ncbi:hypothetical protein B0H13DRAFT_1926064 [Mycena leptocephala]|nr:hypothetical protein B0H13DRAFT_1926064 [Mycena leptocephala]
MSVPSGASGPGALSDVTISLAVLYYSLEIAAIILIGAGILPALFFGRVSRTITWYSFMLSWMWYSIANVILAGRQISTEPPFSLCLFQAGLIYASPVLSSLHCRAVPSIVLSDTWFANYKVKTRALFLEVLIVGKYASAALTATTLYCKYRQIHTMKINSPFSLTLFIRTVFFTFVATIGLTIGLARSAVGLKSPSPNLQMGQTAAQASVPVLCALVFLTQLDIIQSWSLCGRARAPSPPTFGPTTKVSAV